jgi:TonB family protein
MWFAVLTLAVDPALLFAPAKAINEEAWLTADDYPYRAQKLEHNGVTQEDIFINAMGKPETCTIIVSSGSKDLDSTSCAAAIRRGRFTPARDETGKPMNGVYRFRTIWFQDEVVGKLPADVTLSIAKLPHGTASATVNLRYIVDEQGRIIRCAVDQTSGVAELDLAACSAMRQRYRFAPARDGAGRAWPVVRTQSVAFDVATPPSGGK